MATPDAGLVVYGSKEWEEKNAAEVALRPRVLPLSERHYFSPAELEAIRQNMAAGMKREDAIKLALGAK